MVVEGVSWEETQYSMFVYTNQYREFHAFPILKNTTYFDVYTISVERPAAILLVTNEPEDAEIAEQERAKAMWSLQDVDLIQEHAKDLVRETAQARLISNLSVTRRPSGGAYRSAMARLGGWMIAWGWRLRARNAAIEFGEETRC